jgi:hypothetical protein
LAHPPRRRHEATPVRPRTATCHRQRSIGRKRAEEAKAEADNKAYPECKEIEADNKADPECKEIMLDIARAYERIADAARREEAKSKTKR